MKNQGIYQIRNNISKTVYIGSTQNFGTRWAKHERLLRGEKHPNPRLQRDWTRQGPEEFEFLVVEYIEDAEKLTEREQYWLDYFREKGSVYNVMEVGEYQRGPRVDWDDKSLGELGKVADSIIADNLGVSRKTVGNQRHRLGIPPSFDKSRMKPPPAMGGWNKINLPEEVIRQLGSMSDEALARQVGVSKKKIQKTRRNLGIPSYAEVTGRDGKYQKGNYPSRWLNH